VSARLESPAPGVLAYLALEIHQLFMQVCTENPMFTSFNRKLNH